MPAKAYLEKLYKLGADDDFDSIAIHPYANNATGSVAQLETRAQGGGRRRRPQGRHVGDRDRLGRRAARVSNPYVKGLVGQARVLTRALSAYKRKARSFHLRGVFWYSWRDKKGGDAICDWCGHAGLRSEERGREARLEGVRPSGSRVSAGCGRAAAPAIALALIALLGVAASAAAAVPKRFFGVMPQGPLERRTTTTRWATPTSARCASRSPGPAIDPSLGPRRLRLVDVGRGRRRAPPRNGVATLPFVTSAPGWVAARSTATAVRSASCPPYAPRGERGARGLAHASSPTRSTATAPAAASGTSTPTLPELPIRAWQIWNEQNSPSFWKPKPNVKAYAKLLDSAHTGDHRRRPGGEDHPRRHVRDPARRPQAGDLGLGLPREALSPARARSATSTASPRTRTRRSSRRCWPRSTCCATRWSPPTIATPSSGSPRSAGRRAARPNPLNRGLAGPGRPAARGVQVLHREAPQAQRRGADLVLVARQHRRRRAASASGARNRVC